MIIKIILSLGFSVLFVYAFLARKSTRAVASIMIAAVFAGLVVVWAPQLATDLANLMGIGRGADLITYIWILASMLVALNLHLKCRELNRDITVLARIAALQNARVQPDGPPVKSGA